MTYTSRPVGASVRKHTTTTKEVVKQLPHGDLGTLKTREWTTRHQVAGVENALAGELREFRASDSP